MESTEVRKYIERLERLSTIPVVLKQIFEVTRDPSSPPEELYRIISRDQSLAERIVGLANSSFFKHSPEVTDIEQAIMLLGYEHIRTIAAGMGVFMSLTEKGDRNLRNFWAHSCEVAFVASLVAEKATIVNPGNAFLAGLLHDTGRLIFFKLRREEYKAILGTDDILEREEAIFGCDHALAGSWLAEKAQLSEDLVLSIRFHHRAGGAPSFKDTVSVVSMAEVLSRSLSPKIEDDGIWTAEHDAIMLEFGLNDDDIIEIGDRLQEEEFEIRTFLELF